MGVMGGTRQLKAWAGDYDFARDGGAQGTIPLKSEDGPLPAGAVIVSGYLDVTTAVLSATGTVALQAEAAADIKAASAQAALTVGRKDIIPAGIGSTSVKTTAERAPAAVIATAPLTAGKFTLVLFYR